MERNDDQPNSNEPGIFTEALLQTSATNTGIVVEPQGRQKSGKAL